MRETSECGGRVLVLDDDPTILRLLSRYLRSPSVDLVICQEIEAAEHLVHREPFDVLVTDLEVSDLGGLEGMRLVRHVAVHFPDTRVVVFSGKLDDGVRRLGAALGADEILAKPKDLSRLRELVLGHLGAPEGSTESPPGQVSRVETIDEVLERRCISAVLQPIMALPPNGPEPRPFAVEGLARGPEGSPLRNPEVLLGYASKKEKLVEVELLCIEAVLREACQVEGVGKLFLNTHPRTVSSPHFAPAMMDLIKRYGFREENIVLELTEQQSILNPQGLNSALRELREYGFGCALDDYGSGFANLHLVQDLELDYIKIDGFFCCELDLDQRKQAIVRSTVEMAQQLGVHTVLERVETPNEFETARQLGLDYLQGYYFSAPVPGSELTDLFAGETWKPAVSTPPTEPAAPPAVSPAASAHHELSNVLTAAVLFASEGCRRLEPDNPLYEDLRQIRGACEQAITLMEEIRQV